MGAALKITRTEHSPEELRRLASKCRDGEQVRRLLAIALVLEGHSRTQAAEQNGMERQTLRDWVHHYNESGCCQTNSKLSPSGARTPNRTSV